MVGVAFTAAETYARFNIPVIPLGKNKKPSVGNFTVAELTVSQSMTWLRQRPKANALGVPDGRLSGIVRLDIDERDDELERAVIQRAGDTPFKVRTASGKMHLLYRDNGERRLTARRRPGRKDPSNLQPWDDLCVDLCGTGGYSVSPPSQCAGGEYRFLGDVTLEQLLAHRHELPIIQGLPDRAYKSIELPASVILPDGVGIESGVDSFPEMRANSGRNTALFDALCKEARHLPPTIDAFEARARELNQMFGEPMIESRVINTAKSVFRYVETGQLRTGGHGAWFKQDQAQQLARDPYFFALIAWLKAENGPDAEFLVADGLGAPKYLEWPIERLRQARRRAMVEGWIIQIRKPAPGVAALYRWGPAAYAQRLRDSIGYPQ